MDFIYTTELLFQIEDLPELDVYAADFANALVDRISKPDEKEMEHIDIENIFIKMKSILNRYKKVTKRDIRAEIESTAIINQLNKGNLTSRIEIIRNLMKNYEIRNICINLQ